MNWNRLSHTPGQSLQIDLAYWNSWFKQVYRENSITLSYHFGVKNTGHVLVFMCLEVLAIMLVLALAGCCCFCRWLEVSMKGNVAQLSSSKALINAQYHLRIVK